MLNRQIFRLTALVAVAAIFGGCASQVSNSTYVPPRQGSYANSTEMPYPFDEAWTKLVRAASGTFFAIENFEKDSGLMTLSFSTSESDSINCGTMNGEDYVDFWNRSGGNVSIQGKMNLLVSEVDNQTTLVTVNTRYIVSMENEGYQYNWITSQNQYYRNSLNMSFDSNGIGSDNVQIAAQGTTPTRSCAPTGEVESQVLAAIAGA